MATHGSISEFHGNAEEWTSYIERLECYFTANDVTSADKNRAILLAAAVPPRTASFAAWRLRVSRRKSGTTTSLSEWPATSTQDRAEVQIQLQIPADR